MKAIWISVVVIVLLVAAGAGIWLNRQTGLPAVSDVMAPEGMLDTETAGDGGLAPVQATLEEMAETVTEPAEDSTSAAATGGGEELVEQAGPVGGEAAVLEPVGNFTGSGIATRQFDGTTFIHEVVALLSPPAEGTFYEGWLVKKEPSLEFFSTGVLEAAGEGQYSLLYTAQQEFAGFDDVVITQETAANGLDGVPEDHVLEGTFGR